jgi:hypothetical protein
MYQYPFFKKPGEAKGSPLTQSESASDTTVNQTPAENPKKSPTEQLLNLADSNITYFLSPLDEPHCSITINGHKETFRVNSKEFRQYLRMLHYEKHRKQVTKQTMEEVVELLEGKARFKGTAEPLFIRVAGTENKVFIDLCDKERNVLEISQDGWRITKNPPVHLIRKKSMYAISTPEREGTIQSLRRFVNFKSDDDFLLYVSWLCRSWSPKGPYPVLVLKGRSGAAKSTLMLISRLLIDPSLSPNRSAPKSDRDLFIAAANNWCLSFDNLSFCPDWLSDRFCLIATGGGYGTRKNYTDEEETIIHVARPIVLTGIHNLVTRNDLVERSIILNLPEIDESARLAEGVFWTEFMKERPAILGAMCDIVSTVLKNLDSVKTDGLPRMADFARWILAAKEALPPSPRGFLDIYRENQNALVEVALETDPMAQAVLSLMENRTVWKGTAAEALRDLGKQPVVSDKTRLPSWPKAPNKLREHLQNVEPYLLNHGITIEFDLRENQGARKLRFEKAAQAVSPEVSTDSAEPKASDAENELYQSVFDMEMLRSIQDKLDSSPPPEKEPEIEEEGLYQSVFDSDDHDKPL